MLSAVRSCSFFFFFQAEDGIRDYKVTGVQTCALPICSRGRRAVPGRRGAPLSADWIPVGAQPRQVRRRGAEALRQLLQRDVFRLMGGHRESDGEYRAIIAGWPSGRNSVTSSPAATS